MKKVGLVFILVSLVSCSGLSKKSDQAASPNCDRKIASEHNKDGNVLAVQKLRIKVNLGCSNSDVIAENVYVAFDTPTTRAGSYEDYVFGMTHKITEGNRVWVLAESGDYIEIGRLDQQLSIDNLDIPESEKARCRTSKGVLPITHYNAPFTLDQKFALVVNTAKLKKTCDGTRFAIKGDKTTDYMVTYMNGEAKNVLASGLYRAKDRNSCVTLKSLSESFVETLQYPFVYIYSLIFWQPS